MRSIFSNNQETEAVEKTAVDKWAEIISWAMTPLIMPVVGIAFIFCFTVLSYVPLSTKFWVTAIVFGINALLPCMIFLILKFLGVIDDIGLNERKERAIPYAVMIVCFLLTAWFVFSRNAPLEVVGFFVGGALSALLNLIVNFRWKISAHAAATAGVVALLTILAHSGLPGNDGWIWLIVWVLLSGALGAARIWLGRHTPMQVLAGYASGYFCVWLTDYIIVNIIA